MEGIIFRLTIDWGELLYGAGCAVLGVTLGFLAAGLTHTSRRADEPQMIDNALLIQGLRKENCERL